MNISNNFKSGYISIIGKPNVGKSTLINQLLDFKLSITSPRPQTTRRRVMGIMNDENFQIIFLDTPGILEPKYKLQQVMMKHVNNSITDADAVIFMIEMKHSNTDLIAFISEHINILSKINMPPKPVLLVINKIDLFSKNELLPLIDLYSQKYPFQSIVPISALKGDGLSEFKDEMIKILPYHPPYYDPDILTEQPERFFVAELIREKIFMQFREEIPYSTEVKIEEFKERENGKNYIEAVIYTERESQKGILIGKNGIAIKKIGIEARKEIEKFLEKKVYLTIKVKVCKDWRKDGKQIAKFGF